MKNISRLVMLCLLLASLGIFGCGGGNVGQSNQQSSPANMAGNWQFTAHSNTFDFTVAGNGTLQQSGTSVSGQVNLSGTPCAATAALSGTVNGTAVTFQLQEGSQAVSFTGTVTADGSSASGAYMAPSGGCTNGDVGTWSGNKVTSSPTTQQLAAGPWHFASQSTMSKQPMFIEANLQANGSAVTISSPAAPCSTVCPMTALVVPGPPPLSKGANGGPAFLTPVWGGFGSINVSVQVQGSNVSLTIPQGLSSVVSGVGTLSTDGTHITGTYQFADGSDHGTFTADNVPLWTGTYAGTLANDPFFPNENVTMTITENADYTVAVSGTFSYNGFAIGNLVFIPKNVNNPSNLVGIRTDNSGHSVNFWEEGTPPFPYLGVVNKQ